MKKYKLIEFDVTKRVPTIPKNIVIHLMVYLNKNSDISIRELGKIKTILNKPNKFILRFAYIADEDISLEPPVWRIEKNCRILMPVLNNYSNIISLQMGFFGKWGEGYYTRHTREDFYKIFKIVYDKYLGQIQLRTIKQKTDYFGLVPVNRIGFFNDAFLNKWGHGGTFNVDSEYGEIPAEDLEQYFQQASVGIMSAETNGLNPPHTDWNNARESLEYFKIQYLNGDYHPDVLINWEI